MPAATPTVSVTPTLKASSAVPVTPTVIDTTDSWPNTVPDGLTSIATTDTWFNTIPNGFTGIPTIDTSFDTDPSAPAERVSPVDEALRYLAQAGYKGLTVDDLARLSPPDRRFDDELIVMADVRAYFTIACKVGDIHQTDMRC